MDRASRLFTSCAVAARAAGDEGDVAVVAGSAWGSPAATGKILRELYEKGSRFVSPAVFPGALPSALASSASIYLGAHGVAFTTADGAASAESAILSAIELVERGEMRAVLCGGVEEASEVAERVSSPVGSGIPNRGRRGEGAGVLLVESAVAARAPVLAEIVHAVSWQRSMPQLPAPASRRAKVFVAREDLEVPSAWQDCPRQIASASAGDHEAVGAVAFVSAVQALEPHGEALVLGVRHAFVLRRGGEGT
jgi:3-oxoacyl-[acyl-carrier-protein] synthase II